MTTSHRAAEILSTLYETVSTPDGSDLPVRLVEACVDALPIVGAGLVLTPAGRPMELVAASDSRTERLQELQFTLGTGPLFTSSSEGRPVLQPDLARFASSRWPELVAGAESTGIRALFAFPLQVGAIRVGVLELHADATGSPDATGLQEAFAFADAATSLMLDLQAGSDEDTLHPGVAVPLDSRTQIHQATGMVAVQAGVTLAEALVLLRARSFSSDTRMVDLARQVVERILRFDG